MVLGHEHNCVIYDPHPKLGLRGRCLGNGGVPLVREKKVKQAPAEKARPAKLEAPGEDQREPACIVARRA
jgi:hypothetical protein